MTRIGSKELKQIKRGIERVVAFSFFFASFVRLRELQKWGKPQTPISF